MFVQVGNIQFAMEHLKDKTLKEAQQMFKHVNPITVKKAFEMVNKASKKRLSEK